MIIHAFQIRDFQPALDVHPTAGLMCRYLGAQAGQYSGLLMEAGVPYNQQKVHQKKYFAELLQKQKKEMPPSMPELLRLSRSTVEAWKRAVSDQFLVCSLEVMVVMWLLRSMVNVSTLGFSLSRQLPRSRHESLKCAAQASC